MLILAYNMQSFFLFLVLVFLYSIFLEIAIEVSVRQA